jgi:uncharacterized membrane protein
MTSASATPAVTGELGDPARDTSADRRSGLSVVSRSRSAVVAYSATALYALVFTMAAVVHFKGFQSGRGDLGTMVQAIWSTAHGHFLEVTAVSGQEITRLAGHVDPFLVLFVPLWRIWPSPLLLLVVQAVAVSAGALPVYWLARKHLRSGRAAAHFALAYLLYPATQFSAFTITSGFHSVSMAVPLILFAIWFLDQDRLVPFAIVALLAASTKEEIPAAVGLLGLWYAARTGKRVTGVAILAAGLAISTVDFLVVIPHFSPTGADPFAGRYTAVGGTPTGILRHAFTDPGALVHAVASVHKLVYALLLLVPFLGLWALEPLLFLGAFPDLAINLLSSHGDQTAIPYHWVAGIIPFTVAAAIVGTGRLRRHAGLVSLAILVAVACTAIYSPLYGLVLRGELSAARPSNVLHEAKANALALVPPSVPVAASNQLGAYVSARRYVYVFPFIRNARWIVIDRNNPSVVSPTEYRRAVTRIDADRRWKRVYSSHGIQVLRKVGGR